MATRIVLALSAALWLPYGLYCFLVPGALLDIAGVAASGSTGAIELRAMYGGLQAGIGSLALAGLLRDAFQRPALVALLFLCGGLLLARLAGVALEGELSSYTISGLGFEAGTVGLAGWRLGRAGALA